MPTTSRSGPGLSWAVNKSRNTGHTNTSACQRWNTGMKPEILETKLNFGFWNPAEWFSKVSTYTATTTLTHKVILPHKTTPLERWKRLVFATVLLIYTENTQLMPFIRNMTFNLELRDVCVSWAKKKFTCKMTSRVQSFKICWDGWEFSGGPPPIWAEAPGGKKAPCMCQEYLCVNQTHTHTHFRRASLAE